MTGRFTFSSLYNKLKNYIKPTDVDGGGEDDVGGDVNIQLTRQNNRVNQNLLSSFAFAERNNGTGAHHQQQQFRSTSSNFSSYFPFGSRRKRPADQRVTEIEFDLTDDEEDPTKLNGGSSYHHHQPKKLRTTPEFRGGSHSQESERRTTTLGENMAEDGRRYVTRGSGIDPAIKGVDKQPWMFNFNFKRSRTNTSCNETSVVEVSRGTLYGKESTPGPSSSSATAGNSLSSQNKKEQSSATSDCFKNFRFQKNQKEIEVITIDDSSNNGNFGKAQLSRNLENHAHAVVEKKLKSPMKSNFFKSLLTRGSNPENLFRYREKQEYANLVKKMTMFSGYGSMVTPKWAKGRALERSKLKADEVTARYNNFGTPSVTFRKNQSILGSPYVVKSSGQFQRPLAGKSPHNFSMPSSQKNTPAASTPELIDISFDEDEDEAKHSQAILPVVPNGSNQLRQSLHTSFHDLNEALQSGIISESEDSQDNLLAVKGQPDSSEVSEDSQDPDISIISKTVLEAKPRSRRLNSLALEHQDLPYTKKDWLDDVSSTWREEQKHREKQILENMETIDVLQKESTIEKDLRERMRNRLRITEIIVLEEPPPSYPDISQEMLEVIDHARRPGYDNDVLATVFGVSVTRGDIKTLAPCKWLNDNVINVYMELISKRSKQEAAYPTVHAFSTFFYPKLMKEGYSNALKRWTRKVDIFANDLLVFPIHLGLHWCLACVDFRDKTIKYYDSLGGRNDKCLHSLLNYIALERKERKSEMLNKDEWKLENVEDTPQQQNGSDCGMFSCKVAEYLSRDAELTFSQENMNYFRERMIYEIIKSDLLFP